MVELNKYICHFVFRYNLKDDVRQSLYDVCREWTKQLGNNPYLGGEKPNLADIVSV